MIKFVYIASPYTKGDPAVNVRNSLNAADQLCEAGFIPFAPLLFHLWHLVTPKPYSFWTRMGLGWVDRCDAVVRLPGESKGADKEVERALLIKIPVFPSVKELIAAVKTGRRS
jgi:hypothetical protein